LKTASFTLGGPSNPFMSVIFSEVIIFPVIEFHFPLKDVCTEILFDISIFTNEMCMTPVESLDAEILKAGIF
jgi:hypothetical protein